MQTRKDWAKRLGAADFAEYFDEEETAVLSLETLRNAFADIEAENQEDAESTEKNEETETDDGEYERESVEETDEDSLELPLLCVSSSQTEVSPKSILEAMLFVGNRDRQPLSAERAAEKMRNVLPEEIEQAVAELNQAYFQNGCPYEIRKEPAGYRLVLRSGFEPVLEKFYGKLREAVLSQPAIDTLAVVAYRQPITAEEVQKIRKQPSISLLNQLVKRGLLAREERNSSDSSTLAGKKKKEFCYKTTERFLELFHLKSLEDLPLPEDIAFW